MSKTYSRVLITGGSGFIGSYVARTLLAQGRDVVNVDVHPPAREAAWILGDGLSRYQYERCGVEDWGPIMEIVERHRPDAIVHAAAIVDVGRLRTDPLPAARVNFGGTLNILEAARQCKTPRVLLVSSIGVLPTIQVEPVPPDHPLILAKEGPTSGFYAAAKVASEAFGYAYLDGFGLDFRIVRPTAPYGVGMGWPMYVKTMVEGAVRGDSVSFESGGPYPRAYTYIEDLVDLMVRIIDAPDDADRVFYGSNGGELVTASQVAAFVRDAVPGADIEIGDTLGPKDRYELQLRKRLSIANAREQLGFEPRYVDMGDGVAAYVDRYRAFLASPESDR